MNKMKIKDAVKILDDKRWNGRRWGYDSHMAAAYFLDESGNADEFDYAFDNDTDAIAIATGILAQERVTELEAEAKHQRGYTILCERRAHGVEEEIATVQQRYNALRQAVEPWINEAWRLTARKRTGVYFIGGVCMSEETWRALAALAGDERKEGHDDTD